MTIASTTVANSGSSTNGATTQFSFAFHIADYGDVEAEDQIVVRLVTTATGAETVLTRGTSAGQYSVSINADQSASPGGSITTITTYASGYKIWIELSPSFLQATDYQNQGAFLMETVEDQADQQARQILVLKDQMRRTPHLNIPAGASFDGAIAGPFTVGYGLVVNGTGTGFSLSASLASATVSAAMAPVIAGSIASALNQLGITAASALATAGGTTTYTLATGLSVSAYVLGQTFLIRMNATNTGASTLNVDSLGAKNIYKRAGSAVAACVAGDLVSGVIYRVSYDGTQFVADTAGVLGGVATQVFTSSGTYTPTAGMRYCIVECLGGGGGGGSVTAQTGTNIGAGGGGGSGGYARKLCTAANIGASQTVTIGAAGTGGTAGNNNATSGGDTSVGSLCIGKGGQGAARGIDGGGGVGGAGGIAGTGDFTPTGSPGGPGQGATITTVQMLSGGGGSTLYGGGGQAIASAGAGSGAAATNYGGGGSGAVNNTGSAGGSGGNGAAGVVIVTEYF